MSDSAINRTSDVASKAGFAARDKVVADIPPAAPERILEFFPEESLTANFTPPFLAPPHCPPDEQAQIDRATIGPAKVSKLVSITAVAPVTAAKPKSTAEAVQKKWSTVFSRPSTTQMAIAVLSIIAVAEFVLLASRDGQTTAGKRSSRYWNRRD
jgi:hypothetical protein